MNFDGMSMLSPEYWCLSSEYWCFDEGSPWNDGDRWSPPLNGWPWHSAKSPFFLPYWDLILKFEHRWMASAGSIGSWKVARPSDSSLTSFTSCFLSFLPCPKSFFVFLIIFNQKYSLFHGHLLVLRGSFCRRLFWLDHFSFPLIGRLDCVCHLFC